MTAEHSPAPWKLTLAGNLWGLAHKGAKPREATDLAQGSTYSEHWRHDAALIRAAPDLLAALRRLADNPAEPEATKAARAAIRRATTPIA